MPSWEERFPRTADELAKLKIKYPDFYQLGAQEGIAELNAMMTDARGAALVCKTFGKM